METLISPLLWLLDVLLGRQRRLRVLAHRAVFDGDPRQCLFVKVTNVSYKRPVSVTHVWVNTEPSRDMLAVQLPARLELEDQFETWIPIEDLPDADDLERLVMVELSNGKKVKSRPNRDVRPIGYAAGLRTITVRSVPVTGAPSTSPAFTSRWRHTSDGIEAAPAGQLDGTAMPGATDRRNEVPSVRVGVVLPCEPLDVGTGSSGPATNFLGFLAAEPVASLLSATTFVDPDAGWSRLAGNGALRLDAVWGREGDRPASSAMLLLPQQGIVHPQMPSEARFWLHIEPRNADGGLAAPGTLADWLRRLERTILLAEALADFLHSAVDLATFRDPPAKVVAILQTPHSMAELVDAEKLKQLPGGGHANHFITYAIADEAGKTPRAAAADMVKQLCDHTMHLADFEPVVDALCGSDRN